MESVDEYIHRVFNLNSGKGLTEEFLISIIEKGFRKNLAQIITLHRAETMREIAAIAEMTVAVSAQPTLEDMTATIKQAVFCSGFM